MATDMKQVASRGSAVDLPRIPPLENGDRLSRDEFERRYSSMPHVKKAELIEGIVYMPSPVSHSNHARPHCDLMGWIACYSWNTPGVDRSDNGSVRLDPENMPQPDGFLMIRPSHGGTARLSADEYVEGAPELVVEVASTSASRDLNQKLEVYRRNGVQEYVVFRSRQKKVDWFVLCEGQFEALRPSEDGVIRSRVFPGLWLDPESLINDDTARFFAVILQGLASPEHAAFVEKLRQKAAELAEPQS